MRALVTGASGFIGSTLIEELPKQGIEAFALMRPSSQPFNLEGLRYRRVEGDLSDTGSLRRAVQGMDVVFHLAGATSAPDRAGYFKHNAEGTRNLAEAIAEANPGLKRLVYVSSLAAGGPAPDLSRPRTEAEPERPVSAYGESKLRGEHEALKFKNTYPVTIIRPPVVYGPKDKGVFVVIQTVARRLMPLIRGATPDGHKHYSLIHSLDLVQGILAAGRKQEIASGEIFYVSGDGTHTYEEFLGAMASALGRRPWRVPVPRFGVRAAAILASGLGAITGRTYPLNLDKLREILPDYWICSNEKAKRELGFAPRFPLAEGMAHAIDWYKARGWL